MRLWLVQKKSQHSASQINVYSSTYSESATMRTPWRNIHGKYPVRNHGARTGQGILGTPPPKNMKIIFSQYTKIIISGHNITYKVPAKSTRWKLYCVNNVLCVNEVLGLIYNGSVIWCESVFIFLFLCGWSYVYVTLLYGDAEPVQT